MSGVDDGLVDGDIAYRIEFDSVVSDDPDYDGLTPPPVEAVNQDNDSPAPPPSGGTITYTLDHESSGGGTKVYRISTKEGAIAEDITTLLNDKWPGEGDMALNSTPNGDWLVLRSERFESDCNGWPCLAVLPADLSTAEVIRTTTGNLLRSDEWAAVGNDGKQVVFSDGNGPKERDLWRTKKTANGWGEPELLTSDSPYQFNTCPSISNEGSKIIFEAGNDPYLEHSVCEVLVDGTSFSVVLAAKGNVKGTRTPDYAPDDESIVFEVAITKSAGGGEYIASIGSGQTTYKIINEAFTNDHSSCVLADGRIASLWLGRPGGSGHELKVMSEDGKSFYMLLENIDIEDIGIGCGG